MESGPKYAFCKYGIVKLLVIAFGCVTFALMADVGYGRFRGVAAWAFAAFIISFAISVIFYIIRVTGASKRITSCGPCTLDGFDFLWSWFSTMWCLAAAVWFVVHFPRRPGDKLIAAAVFAFATAIMYAIEAYMLRDKAPANLGYLSTRNGWLKTIIIALGAAAFGLLVDTGTRNCGGSCYSATTYALVAYIVAWAVTVLLWLGHLLGVAGGGREGNFGKFEFFWSVFSVLLFWSASACWAWNVSQKCDNRFKNNQICQKRLAGVIIGFVTGILYIVEAALLRGYLH